MEQVLDQVERRVLGVLIEKSLAQPDYYPMTLNAVVAACNQKSNRDPTTDIDEASLFDTLEALRQRGLVGRILPGAGTRSDRFKQEVHACWGWGQRQQAIMAELLLRGPQTVGELRTRCARMVKFEDTQAVSTCLQSLAEMDPPLAAPLPREPGQSVVRYEHLLCPPEERAAPVSQSPATSAVADAAESAAAPAGDAGSSGKVQELSEQLENVQAEIADLHQGLLELRRKLEVLEDLVR